jgi:hypothetical protein
MNPVIEGGNQISYSGNKTIHMSCQPGTTIYYTINGQDPKPGSALVYKGPVEISNSAIIKAISVTAKGNLSKVTTARFHRRANNYSVISSSKYESQYSGGGADALVDEMRGTLDWRKGNWQGYEGKDFDVVIDMNEVKKVSQIIADFLQDSGAWIIMPRELIVEVSTDGKNFNQVYEGKDFLPIEDAKVQTKEVIATFPETAARYLHVKAIQYGKLPSWHSGAGGDSHIFVDEISIK